MLTPEGQEIDAAAATLMKSIKRRLVLWAIRWVIGFGLIALAVRFWPNLGWLWWVGAAVASLSLVVMVAMHFFVQRRMAEVKARLEAAEAQAAALEPHSTSSDDLH